MNKRPILRMTLFLLPALLLINLLLYSWFARKTRETSADEVVQKAYIVSRMLSEFSARYLDRGDLVGLKRVVEESFKDRHIVAVGVLDLKGKAIVQSTVPVPCTKLSTFNTPVKRGEKIIATMVTSFHLDESDELIAGRLRRTGALQFGALALIAAVLAYFCWREKCALDAAAEDKGGNRPLASFSTDALLPAATPHQAAELGSVRNSLEHAAKLLVAESGRQQHLSRRMQEYLGHIDLWHQQALQGRGNAESLLVSGREIVAMVKGAGAGTAQTDVSEVAARENLAAKRAVEEIVTAVELLAGELQQSGELNPRLSPDETLLASAQLVREGVATIRQRVFPSLATAVAAGENIAQQLAPLLEKVDECGDRSVELTRRSGELLDLADAVRLLRRDLVPDDSRGGEGVEGRLNSLAEWVESLAARLKSETRDLLGAANEATAVSRSILTTVETSRDALLAAGSTVEDAAAASLLGSDHLHRFLRTAGVEMTADISPAADTENHLEIMQELHSRLKTLQAELARPAASQPLWSEDHAESLLLACENLQLASRFLGDIAAGADELAAKAAGKAELHDGARTHVDATVGQLLADVNISLAQLLPPPAVGGGELSGEE